MEILHRLEVKESVSVDEIIYLHSQAKLYPEVAQWVNKLLVSNEPINTEMHPSNDLFAA
tara:strand:+ start:170 stop:346 length:177 start_codon:yes stop_codon:yes gene_type:complete